MYLSLSQCTSLFFAVQADLANPPLPLPVKLAAYASEVEARTRRSVRRRNSNHQRIVKDARALAEQAHSAAQLLQKQEAEIAKLRAEVQRLEYAADDLFWGIQADQHDALEEGRVFMQTCAAEHQHFPSVLAG